MTLVRFNNKRNYPEVWNNVFNRFFEDFLSSQSIQEEEFRPLSNVIETEKGYEVEVALPGFSKQDVNIEVKDGVLTIQGKRESKKDESKYARREFFYNEFTRTFTLPESVDEDKITALFKEGILSLELPKKPESKPKVINVKVD